MQTGFLAAQLGEHRVFTAPRNTGVENFYQHIDIRKNLGHFFPGLVHMARKPLNRHESVTVLIAQYNLGRLDTDGSRFVQTTDCLLEIFLADFECSIDIIR